MQERVADRVEGIEQRGNVWIRRGEGSSAMAISLGDVPRVSAISEIIDR